MNNYIIVIIIIILIFLFSADKNIIDKLINYKKKEMEFTLMKKKFKELVDIDVWDKIMTEIHTLTDKIQLVKVAAVDIVSYCSHNEVLAVFEEL